MASNNKKIKEKKLEKYQNGSAVDFIPSITNIFSQGLGIAPNISNTNGNPFGTNPFGGQLTNNIFNTGQDLQGLFGQEFQNQKPMSYSDWLKKGNRNDDLISKVMYKVYEKDFNKQLEDNKTAFEQAKPLMANMTALDELNKMSTLEYNKGLKRDFSDVSNDPRGMESRGIFQSGGNPKEKVFPSIQEFMNKKAEFVNKYTDEAEKRQELLRQRLAFDGLPEDKIEEVLEIIFTEIPDDLDNDKPEKLQNKLVERIKNETGYFLPNAQKEVTDILKLDNIYRTTMGDFNDMELQMENPTEAPKKLSDKKFKFLKQGGAISPLQQVLGYKDSSPYKNLPFQTINSNSITMDGVSQPLLAIADNGERRVMQPNSGLHNFQGANSVMEIPMAQNGGSLNLHKLGIFQGGGNTNNLTKLDTDKGAPYEYYYDNTTEDYYIKTPSGQLTKTEKGSDTYNKMANTYGTTVHKKETQQKPLNGKIIRDESDPYDYFYDEETKRYAFRKRGETDLWRIVDPNSSRGAAIKKVVDEAVEYNNGLKGAKEPKGFIENYLIDPIKDIFGFQNGGVLQYQLGGNPKPLYVNPSNPNSINQVYGQEKQGMTEAERSAREFHENEMDSPGYFKKVRDMLPASIPEFKRDYEAANVIKARKAALREARNTGATIPSTSGAAGQYNSNKGTVSFQGKSSQTIDYEGEKLEMNEQHPHQEVGTNVHELSHASTRGGDFELQDEANYMKNRAKGTDPYYTNPEEIKARMDVLKAYAVSLGWVKPGENISKKHLELIGLKSKLGDGTDGAANAYKELIEKAGLTDDDLVDIWKNIASAPSNTSDVSTMARNGGRLNIFQQGGYPSNDIELQNSKFGGLDFNQKLTHLKVLKDYVQQYGIGALKESPEDYKFFVQSVREAQLPIQETFTTDPVQDPKKDTPVEGGSPVGNSEVEIKDKRKEKEKEKEKENTVEYKDKRVNTLTQRLRNPYELTTERVTIFDDLLAELNSQKNTIQQEQLYRKRLRDMFSMQQEQQAGQDPQSNIYTGRGRFQSGGVPSMQREGTYNEDVSRKLGDLYKSERYQKANRFEKIGMQAEIDPLSFFETGLGIGNISTGIPALVEGTLATYLSQIGFDLGEDKLKKLKQKSAPNYQGGGIPILNLSGKTNPLRLNPQGMYKFGGLITEGSEYNKRKQPKKNPISGASSTGPMGPKDIPSYDSGIRAIIDQEENEIIPTDNLIPIQTEIGELIILPTGDVVPVMAKKRHKQMEEDEVTDIAPEGAYILSAHGRVKIKKDEADRVITETGIKPYRLGQGQDKPTEKTLADMMNKKEMSPADVGRVVSQKFPVVATSNPYEAAANTENKINRKPYLEGLIQLSEFDKMRKGIDTQSKEIADDVPHAQAGLAIGLGTALLQGITGLFGASAQKKDAQRAYADVLRLSQESAAKQRGQLGLGAAAGIMGTLGQDPRVNPLVLDPTFIRQMETRTPQQVTDAIANQAYANMPDYRNLPANQQLMGAQSAYAQALKAAGDNRLAAYYQDRGARNQQLTSLQGYEDKNRQERETARRATTLNTNQMIGNVGDRTQGYFDSSATIEANLGQTQASARLGQSAANQQAIRAYTQGISGAIGTAGATAYDYYANKSSGASNNPNAGYGSGIGPGYGGVGPSTPSFECIGGQQFAINLDGSLVRTGRGC